MKKNSWVIRNGRTTEVTTGIVNDMERITSCENGDIVSVEVKVFGIWNEFVRYGDSGSVVVGALVG